MESIAVIAAAPMTIELGGRQYLMAPLTLGDYGEIELAIRAHRKDDMQFVAPDEMARWMSDGEGLAYFLWLTVRRRQPELDLDACRALVASEPNSARLARELDRASGLPVGNARGQARGGRRIAMARAV